MKIADFFGSVGFKVNTKPLDEALVKVENRLNRFITHFNGKTIILGARINSAMLNKSITEAITKAQSKRTLKFNAVVDKIKIDRAVVGNAIKAANLKLSNIKVSGKTAAINMDKFRIDKAALKGSLLSVIRQIESEIKINLNVNAQRGRVTGGNVSNRNLSKSSGHGIFHGGFHGGTPIFGGTGGGLIAAAAGLTLGMSTINKQMDLMNSVEATIKAVSGSAQEAKTNSKFLRDISMKYGVDYGKSAHPAALLLAAAKNTSMKGDPARQLIEGLSAYGTVLSLSPEHMEGSYRAVYQMISKGQVMSEELKQQLNEWLPNSESFMAQAFQYSKGNMKATGGEKDIQELLAAMKKGEVKPSAVMGHFAEILMKEAKGGGLDQALTMPARERDRLKNQWMFFTGDLAKAGGDEGRSKFYRTLAVLMEKLTKNVETLGKAFKWLSDRFANLVTDASNLFTWLSKVWTSLDVGQKAIFGLIGALTVLARHPVIATLTAIYLILEDIGTYFRGGDSYFGDFVKAFPEMGTAFKNLFESLGPLLNTMAELLAKAAEGWMIILTSDFTKSLLVDGFKLFLEDLKTAVDLLNQMLDIVFKLTNQDFSGAGKGYIDLMAKQPGPIGAVATLLSREPANYGNYEAYERGATYISGASKKRKIVNGPSPNITINSTVNVSEASPDMWENLQNHVNSIFTEVASQHVNNGGA